MAFRDYKACSSQILWPLKANLLETVISFSLSQSLLFTEWYANYVNSGAGSAEVKKELFMSSWAGLYIPFPRCSVSRYPSLCQASHASEFSVTVPPTDRPSIVDIYVHQLPCGLPWGNAPKYFIPGTLNGEENSILACSAVLEVAVPNHCRKCSVLCDLVGHLIGERLVVSTSRWVLPRTTDYSGLLTV